MNEKLLLQLLQDINRENIRFGSIEVKFTFHDCRLANYELTIHRRRNIGIASPKTITDRKENAND